MNDIRHEIYKKEKHNKNNNSCKYFKDTVSSLSRSTTESPQQKKTLTGHQRLSTRTLGSDSTKFNSQQSYIFKGIVSRDEFLFSRD
jgi:hypothetical protein